MKLLFIPGENDYDALTFEQSNQGKFVKDIMKEMKSNDGKLIVHTMDLEAVEEQEVEARIVEVPDIVISKEFRDFIKNDVMDYDAGKHCNFYLETDYIK